MYNIISPNYDNVFGLILDLSQVNTNGLNFTMMNTVSVSGTNFKTKWMSGFQIVAISTFLLIFKRLSFQLPLVSMEQNFYLTSYGEKLTCILKL